MNEMISVNQTMAPSFVDYKPAKPVEATLPFEQAGPLMNAAIPVLSLAQQISQAEKADDAMEFRRNVIRVVQQFEYDARLGGVPALSVLKARYVLCATLDELILNTPWGQTIGWYKESLLALFHEDTWGGETFFNMLKDLQQEPSMHVELLLLMYLCLSLGFQGKYRLENSSIESLEHIRQHLLFILTRLNAFNENALEASHKAKPAVTKKPWFWRWFGIGFVSAIATTWLGLIIASEYDLHQSLSVIRSISGG